MRKIDHTRLVGTLGQCAKLSHDLHMDCTACKKHHLWRFEELVAEFGAECTVSEWSARYICPTCGVVGAAVLQISVRHCYHNPFMGTETQGS